MEQERSECSGFLLGRRLTLRAWTGTSRTLVVSCLAVAVFCPAARAQFSFGPPSSYVAGNDSSSAQRAIAAADLNGDGFPDVVIEVGAFTAGGFNGVSVLLNNGNGSLTAPLKYSANVPTYGVGVIVKDLNGDGHPDVAIPASGGIGILLNNGNGTLGTPAYYSSGTGLFQDVISSGDYWQNGLTDIALVEVGYFGASPTLTIFKNQGNGTFVIGLQIALPAGATYSLVTADVNDDGCPDLITSNSNGGNTISVFISNCNGTFHLPVIYTPLYEPNGILAADLKGDRYPDVVGWGFGGQTFTEAFEVIPNNGDGTFDSAVPYDTSYTDQYLPGDMLSGDFNGDGKLDLAAYVSSYMSNNFLAVLEGNGDGTVDRGEVFSVPTAWFSGGAQPFGVSDLNADGWPDLVVSDTQSQVVYVLLNTYAGLPQAALSPTTLTFPTQVVGTASKAQPVTLTNTGGGPLTLISIATTGDFSQTNDCGSTLDTGLSCTINVTFKPKAKGTRTGTLTVTDNAFTSPQTASLTGIATVVKLVPPKLNFGSLPVGQTSSPQSVTVTNTASSSLSVSGIGITGTDFGDFKETSTTCTSSLAAHASCTITVTFTPTVKGVRNAQLSITDTGGGSPQKVLLEGQGT